MVEGGRSLDPISESREISSDGGENRLADSLRRDASTGGAKAPASIFRFYWFRERRNRRRPRPFRSAVLVPRDHYRTRATRGRQIDR